MDTVSKPVRYEKLDTDKVYKQLDDGEIVWLIAVKADNSIEMYDTPGNPFVEKKELDKPDNRDFAFVMEGGHCGSMPYGGSIKQCKWKFVSGQLRCRRTLNTWGSNEGCS